MGGRLRLRGHHIRYWTFAASILWLSAGVEIDAESTERPPLIDGVRTIGAPGVPGSLAVFGSSASVIVTGRAGAGASVAVVATGELGRGRVVAFAHDGYFNAETAGIADTGRLLVNATRWAASGKARPRVGLIDGRGLQGFFRKQGIVARPLSRNTSLRAFDVIVITPFALRAEEIARIRAFVRAGGGLLAAATGWGWQQGHAGQPMSRFPGNHLIDGTGLAWSDGFAGRTAPDGYAVEKTVSPLINAATALQQIKRRQAIDPDGLASAMESIRLSLRSLPDNAPFHADVARLLQGMPATDLVPTHRRPVTKADGWRRLGVGLDAAMARDVPLSRVHADPAAREFPGAVSASAPRVRRTTTIDTSVPGWHSLGLYAAPGVRIEVEVPASAASMGLTVQIGSHTDELWHLDRWERSPQIVRRFPIEESRTPAANAFGGLVYIDVPDRATAHKVTVRIKGAVAAPLFELGKTTRAEWVKTLRKRPAPWAELAGHNVIFTVPSRAIQSLDDPEPLLNLWDQIVETQDAFVSLERRRRPERIVADVQISAGYMHSGYPIMVPIDGSLEAALSASRLRKEGSWGHFHELGHNHQSPEWTFGGTGEVTNNVMVLFVYDRVLGLPYDSGHEAIRDRHARAKRIKAHQDAGAPFDKWKSDPFLALMMYIQLYEGFGWAPFEKVFAEYHRLPDRERPRSDEAKRDQWLIRFSKAVGRDLGPFFQSWGVPTSEKARAEVAKLPAWMPDQNEDKHENR